jgi:hypothetical protein
MRASAKRPTNAQVRTGKAIMFPESSIQPHLGREARLCSTLAAPGANAAGHKPRKRAAPGAIFRGAH